MATLTLQERIEKAQSNLDQVNEKIAALRAKARTYEAELAGLKKEQQQQELAQFHDVISAKGLDLSTLLKAIQRGDFDAIKSEGESSNG